MKTSEKTIYVLIIVVQFLCIAALLFQNSELHCQIHWCG